MIMPGVSNGPAASMKRLSSICIGLNFDPNDQKAHYSLGHLLLTQSKTDEATGHLEQALDSDPRNGEFHSITVISSNILVGKMKRSRNTKPRCVSESKISPGSLQLRDVLWCAREDRSGDRRVSDRSEKQPELYAEAAA